MSETGNQGFCFVLGRDLFIYLFICKVNQANKASIIVLIRNIFIPLKWKYIMLKEKQVNKPNVFYFPNVILFLKHNNVLRLSLDAVIK